MLLVNVSATHKDPDRLNDPFEFKPERFEDVEKIYKLILPFRMGRRTEKISKMVFKKQKKKKKYQHANNCRN